MLYALEQGPVEKKIIENCIRDGRPLPKKIQEAPVLEEGLGLYLRAWMDLDSSRQFGLSIGPIPWAAVEQYCRANDYDEEMSEDVHYLVRSMDDAYLESKSKKTPKTGGGGKA